MEGKEKKMTSKKRRTRIAWLIGGIVVLGMGMMVWGNWTNLRLWYYFKIYEDIEAKWEKGEDLSEAEGDFVNDSYSLILEIGEPAVPYLLSIAGSKSQRFKIRTVAITNITNIGGLAGFNGLVKIYTSADIKMKMNIELALLLMSESHPDLNKPYEEFKNEFGIKE